MDNGQMINYHHQTLIYSRHNVRSLAEWGPQNADDKNSAIDVHEAPDTNNAESTKHMFQQLKDICGRSLTQN